jgi:hypothetical protein
MSMMGMIDPSFVDTLTCVKSLATIFESVVPLERFAIADHSFLLVRTIRTSCIIKSPNQ